MKNFTKISRDSRKLYTVVKMHVINSLSVNKCMQRLDVYQIWLITYKYLTLTVSVNFDGFSLNLWSNHESVDLNFGSFGKRDDRLRFWRVLTARIEWKWNEFLSIVSALIKRTWWQHMSFVLELSLQADEKMFIPNEIFFGCAQI